MKKIAFVLLSAVVLLSCKKDEDNNTTSPYMTAKIDGVAKTYAPPTAEKDTTSGVVTIDVHSGSSGSEFLALVFSKNGGVTTGTYSAGNATIFTPNAVSDMYATTTNCTITVTAIDATHVEGTFSGTLVSSSGNPSKVVTEGKFHSKFL